MSEAFASAFALILSGDAELLGIVGLSLRVSLSAVFFASLLALPVGAAVALFYFPGRNGVIVVLNALMGLPPVVAGLIVYLLLSRAGPLGSMGLLFTPTAMVIVQSLLIFPIVAALTRQIVSDLWEEYRDQLTSLGASRLRAIPTLLWDGRFSLITALLAGFGRAVAEVGAVLIVGGNIAGVTRVMTTAIALETNKGNLTLALALGAILMLLTLMINWLAYGLGEFSRRRYGA
ncbi:ABC transporter permease [Spiribacter salinus]|jgi:tungstate transport system permease protein|uniref:ABC transporter permease n=1 Tax=Spiribacter salinus TaxID=1335746 RepID=UPI001C96DD1A|nr:ABC transporter permease [Spiribacter salinus]MBY5267792.1 ABC transporter permease [Spiribacter salinus]MDR9413391.1 ABC transporter permease [Spiribacter sp.]